MKSLQEKACDVRDAVVKAEGLDLSSTEDILITITLYIYRDLYRDSGVFSYFSLGMQNKRGF